MLTNRILKVTLVVLSGVFIISQVLAYETEGVAISSLLLVLLTLLYYRRTKSKDLYFFAFLITFTLSHIIGHFAWDRPKLIEGKYFVANILYILSYILLIIKVTSQFKLKQLFKKFLVPIIILLALDIFCVLSVADTMKGIITGYIYVLEFAYNTIIMALLSVAVIDYMYRSDNKSMLFLVGTICIVFSEIIQLAYYYILDDKHLKIIYSFFFVLAFLLFYLQSQLQFTSPKRAFSDEQQLEV